MTRVRGLFIAVVVLALSAGLAFAGEPPAAATFGLSNAAENVGRTLPVQAGQGDDEDVVEDEEGEDGEEDLDEDLEDDELDEDEELEEQGAHEAGENCATDPTTLTDEAIAELKHGSLVCWAAHQTEWPEEFGNHGAWVSFWARWAAEGAPTTDDAIAEGADAEAARAKPGKASKGEHRGKGRGLGHSKPG